MQLPPGQQLVAPGKWPIVGEKLPAPPAGPWTVTILGEVAEPRTYSLDDVRGMSQVERTIDVHCVTRWSLPAARFTGVPLAMLLKLSRPRTAASYVNFVAYSARRHSTSLPLADCLSLEALIALLYDGRPLTEEHGGPVRVVVPGRYFYKSLKWLAEIELLAEDRLGHWEAAAGYHNGADPWREQRYIAPKLTKREAEALISSRSFAGLDLRGVDAAGRDLAGLDARAALLRDADFRGTVLRQANFDAANLANARLQRADLRGATFRAADLEGANLCGADLRGADLRGASLTAATFLEESPTAEGQALAAILDSATRLDTDAPVALMPAQQEFLLRAMAPPTFKS